MKSTRTAIPGYTAGVHAPAARVTLTAAFLGASALSTAFLLILAAFKLAVAVSSG